MRTRSKTFLISFASIFGIGLLTVIAANYWIDPANIFRAKYAMAKRAAEILLSGRNLGIARNMDDRLVQLEYVERSRQLPKAIAIGSSRSREISARVVPPNLRFFNHGVSGAGLEDAIAILGLYLEKRHLPKLVIWSVDPWIFNSNYTDSRWRSLGESYRYAAKQMGLDAKPETLIERLQDLKERGDLLLRLDSVVRSVNAYLHGKDLSLSLEQKVQAVDGRKWNRLLVYSDGSFRWGPSILHRTAEEVGRYGREAAEKGLLRAIKNFGALDDRAIRTFSKVVDFLIAKGVKVVIFLPPYEPDAYAVFERRGSPKGLFAAERWLRAFAKRHGVMLVGSYDPKRAHCGRGDFVDAHHPRRVCVNRLLDGVLTEYMR